MANKTFDALPAIPSVSTSDEIPIWDASAGDTAKATVTQLIAALPAATDSTAGTLSGADKTKLDSSTSSSTATSLMARDAGGNTAVNVLTASQVTITGSPVNTTDGTNKAYVDSVAAGLSIKAAVAAATTANITLAGSAPNTLDGVALSLNSRILVKDQSTGTQNGIYYVSTLGTGSNGTWTRATDADTGAKLVTGSYVFVNAGSTNASTSWVMNTTGTITIGTSVIVWVLFSQIANVPATSITGAIVGSQVAAGAISTAKFASGITPIEIVSTMPVSGNFQGRTVFLITTDGSFSPNKIYRWTDTSTTGTTFWTSVVPAVDITGSLTDSQISALAAAKLTGQITTTQISNNAITTPLILAGAVSTASIAAGAVTATQIASGTITAGLISAGAITSSCLAANSVIAGKIAAAAVSTTQLAAGAVTASVIASGTITSTQIAANTITAGNIAAGTITADRLNVSSLSAISANIGTITSGTISGVTISATGTEGTGSLQPSTGRFQTLNGSAFAYMTASNPGTGAIANLVTGYGSITGVSIFSQFTSNGITLKNTANTVVSSLTAGGGSSTLVVDEIDNNGGNGTFTVPMKVHGDNNLISFEYGGGTTLKVKIDSTVFTLTMTP